MADLTAAARSALAALVVLSPVLPAAAGEAVVEAVEVTPSTDGTFRFDVTVRHADEGWDHYADAFTVETADGTVLGTRTLFHPHVEEQPFTRSLSGVSVPESLADVLVRAHDSVHGPGEAVEVPLPR
jgi:hypothetical protein